MKLQHLTVGVCATVLIGTCASPPTRRDAGRVIGGIPGGVIGHGVNGGHRRKAATLCSQADGSWRNVP